ncbi:asparagine synthase (glutamine-hydrolyzing) [Bordetella bronchiseptica OSU553]|nr:asparagine synthase (glutamine-hydrolyzing) [Bordetella bronchiseptica OSU553]
MCGVLGAWWRHHDEHEDARFAAGLRKLAHRGPDDRGSEHFAAPHGRLSLGHTRLAVIDLSAAGHQPMHADADRLAVVFNGEIYNYRELRSELRQIGAVFRGDSDTEVLLAAWQHWGVAALRRFKGMFAFALYDRRQQTLTLARDAFGIKPMYYHAAPERLLFGSELPAVQALLPHPPRLNWQRAYDYLAYGQYDQPPDTFIAGIRQLPAGHLLTLDLRTGQAGEPMAWDDPASQECRPIGFQEAAEELRARFLDNVRLHLRSDVPIGAALSGGIDSSAIVCAMRWLEPDLPIQTFSFISGDTHRSEERWVDLVNRHCGATGHKIHIAPHELLDDLDDLIRVQGEPVGSTSIYAQYRVFKLAREHGVVVTLDGQGADELLGGYGGYPTERLASLLETGRLGAAARLLRQQGRGAPARLLQAAALAAGGRHLANLRHATGRQHAPAWLDAQVLRDQGVTMREPAHAWAAATPLRGRRLVNELAHALYHRGLGALLRHGDRNSMRFSVESRVPFLTQDLAEFALSLPERYLVSDAGQTKHIFRKAMRGIVPDSILDRDDKIGFATPEQQWMQATAPQMRQWLVDAADIPFLRNAEVTAQFDAMIAGATPFSWQAWRWVNFQRWMQHATVLP